MKIRKHILLVSAFALINFASAKISVLNAKENQICNRVSKLQFPKNDLPTAKDREALKGCNARNLYYGINTHINYTKARKCALIEFLSNTSSDDFDLFDTANILVMVYANGEEVKRNIDLATKVACSKYNNNSMLGLDIQYIQNLKKYPVSKRSYDVYYDFCIKNKAELIWEGNSSIDDPADQDWHALPGMCNDFETDMQSSNVNDLLKNYSVTQKKELNQLLEKFADFADQQVSTEIHGTDTGGSSEYNRNMELDKVERAISLKGDLILSLTQFEQGKFPTGSEQDYKKALGQLNNLDHKAKAAFNQYKKMDIMINLDWNSEIEVQKQWSQWTKDFIKFANMRYPKLPNYIWNLWLTQQRSTQVKDFIDSLENPQ
ncbi:MAG: hypothetical protein ACK5Z5_03355 [Neisseriaceae bacterium]